MRGPLTAWLVTLTVFAGSLVPCPAQSPAREVALARAHATAHHGLAAHGAAHDGHGRDAEQTTVDAPCPCGCGEHDAAPPAGRLGLAIPEAPLRLARSATGWPSARVVPDASCGVMPGVDHVPRSA